MATNIVTVNVTQTIAPTPSELQKTGAFLSQGGTTTTPGTTTLLTALADLEGVIRAPAALASVILSTAQVTTFTSTQIHGLPIGDVITLTIDDVVSPTTANLFNGTFPVTVTTTNAFTTAAITGTAQAATAATGTWENPSAPELTAMATTFFSQGAQQGVYVLELGPGNPAAGIAFLSDWITAQDPQQFYSYLVPKSWDADPAFLSLLNRFEATTSKTYFFTTTSLGSFGVYTALQKSCFALIEAPTYSVHPANVLTDLVFSGSWAVNVLTAIVWAITNGGTVTATTTTAHGVLPGNTFTISGVTPAGYNGTFVALPGTTASTLKYALAPDPGAETVLGQLAAGTGGIATGTTTSAHGVAVGETFSIANSIGSVIPNGYNGTFVALTGTAGSTLKYKLPANPGNSDTNGNLAASLYASTGAADTEFTCAAPFWVTLNYNPSTTNKVTPTAFAYLFGVTPYPVQGNAAVFAQLQAAFINYVGTGNEGGISTAILRNGNTKDGRNFNYWYSVDWVQITVDRALSNAVINGSNNSINPLYYNQDGINRLQQVVVGVMNSGVSFGLVLGTVTQTTLDGKALATAIDNGNFDNQSVVNAVPFVQYSAANPSHYAIGEYDGLAIVYTPQRGFEHIVVNVNVTDFVTQ